jgi:hypothetical protein
MLACTCFARSLGLVDFSKPGTAGVPAAPGFCATSGLEKAGAVGEACGDGTGTGVVVTVLVSSSEVQLAAASPIVPTKAININRRITNSPLAYKIQNSCYELKILSSDWVNYSSDVA